MNTASEVWTYYTTAPLDLPKQWNWGRKHFRIVLRNRRFLKLNKFRNRLGVEDLGYFCPKYAPVHVYFSVLDRRFPERVGRKYKASYALPASGEYVVDVYSFRARQRKNVGEDWINEGYRKPKISNVFIVEIGCFEHGEISWFLKPYCSKSGFRSLEDWIEEIKRLNKGRLPIHGWLYFVRLVYPNCPNCMKEDLVPHETKRSLLVCPACWPKYEKIPALRGEFIRIKKKVKNPGWAHKLASYRDWFPRFMCF